MENNETLRRIGNKFREWGSVLIASLVCFVGLMYNLFGCQEDYLYALHTHTFFADNEAFYEEIQRESAWGIMLAGRYLTQFFANPTVGITLVLLSSLVLVLLLESLFRLRRRKHSCLLVSLLLLPGLLAYISGQNYDYAIYDRLDGAKYIVLFLGELFSVGLFSLSRLKFEKSYLLTLVGGLLLSPFVGIFSMVAILMVCVESFVEKNRNKAFWSGVFAVLNIVVVLVCGANCFHEFWYVTFFTPLVNAMFGATFFYAIASVMVLVLFPLIQLVGEKKEQAVSVKEILVSIFCSILLVCTSTSVLSYNDKNFYTELKAKRLLDAHDWKKLYSVTSKAKNPTTTLVAYQEISLLMREKLLNEAFNIEPVFHSYNTSHFVAPHFVHYSELAYYSGLPNVATFYAMETKQLSGLDFGVLKVLQESAMLNREYDLARKYQDILAGSPVYKDYAERWRSYIADKEKMYKDLPHLRMTERVYDPAPAVFSAESVPMIMMNRETLDNGMTLMLRLYSDLYQRDMQKFSRDISACGGYFATRKVPAAIQEACVICQVSGDPVPARVIRVDNEIARKVYGIIQEINTINNDAVSVKRLYSRYKGTYTYYYMLSTTDESMYRGEDISKEEKK